MPFTSISAGWIFTLMGLLDDGRPLNQGKSQFFKFPSTPHLACLGHQLPRDDKLMTAEEVRAFLSSPITIEEKLDGANLGISLGDDGQLVAQNRGSYLHRDVRGQFNKLWQWIDARSAALVEALSENLILFGEWCYAEHSISYHNLPDWFVGFDVYDRHKARFFSVDRRNQFLANLGISPIAVLGRGRYQMDDLKAFLSKQSHYGASDLEGIYIRKDEGSWLAARAKLVRPDFTQAISDHWSSRRLRANRIVYG